MAIDMDGLDKWLTVDDLEKMHRHGFDFPINDGQIVQALSPRKELDGRTE